MPQFEYGQWNASQCELVLSKNSHMAPIYQQLKLQPINPLEHLGGVS